VYTAFVGVVRKYVLAFSVRVNGLRILSVERPPKDGSTLPALHGIRFLSMSWVILGHTYVIGIAVTSKLLMILMLTVICSVVFQLRKLERAGKESLQYSRKYFPVFEILILM